jgi:hypothetical protein
MANFDATPFLAASYGISANAAADIFIPIPSGQKRVIFDKVTFTNPSATLASATTTAGLYTAVSAGGSAISTSATGNLTPLTAAAKFKDGTIASPATTDALLLAQQTSGANNGLTGVFVNVGGTPNVAATFDVYVQGRILS